MSSLFLVPGSSLSIIGDRLKAECDPSKKEREINKIILIHIYIYVYIHFNKYNTLKKIYL